jgi:Tfp pilus assembly protein PilX
MSSVNAPKYAGRRRRGGYAAMLSMLFLMLFSTLAVGFYASTNTSTQTSENDRRIGLAQNGAEAGLDFMRYQLARVSIPPGTPSNLVMSVLAAQLAANLNGTRNMGSDVVGISGNVIYIPSNQAHSLKLDAAGLQAFRITITAWGSDIVVKSSGIYGSAAPVNRAITMDFTSKPIPTDSFDYAVASKGQVIVSKGTITGASGVPATIAQIMSDQTAGGAITVVSGTVGGDLNILAGASVNLIGGSVGGTSNKPLILAQHVHVVGDPDFPTVDTTPYAQYATNNYVAGASVQQNIVIPPGTNPRFNANDTVQGIMYVRSPNIVTFRGDFKLQGFIVFENAGTSAVNTLDFRGNVTQTPLPAAAQFDTLRTVTGVAVLAPTAAMSMSGSTDSSVKGNIIIGSYNLAGAANVYIDNGTLMTMNSGANSAVFNGSKSVMFTATGAKNQPSTGMSYNSYYAPQPSTYQEILP